jgi:hypothetical protein
MPLTPVDGSTSFTTNHVSLGATLSDPRGENLRAVYYVWYLDTGGTTHYVANAAVSAWASSGTAISWSIGASLTDNYYYWYVRAQNTDGDFSASSPTYHFRVNTHCSESSCHVGVSDADSADRYAQSVQVAITTPSVAQVQVDTAFSNAWVFVNLPNNYEFQVGPDLRLPVCCRVVFR